MEAFRCVRIAPLCGIAALFIQAPELIAQTVKFKHRDCKPVATVGHCAQSSVVSAPDRGAITVLIEQTKPALFDYEIAGIPLGESDEVRPNADGFSNKTLVQVHDGTRFGGYIVRITQKQGIGERALPDAIITIAVRTEEWRASFAGGFAASGLTGKRYALRDTSILVDSVLSPRAVVIRDHAREDALRLSTATFVHLSHSKLSSLAATFGLGLSATEGAGPYFFGGSFLFGERGAVTAGVAIGPELTRPLGRVEGDVLERNADLSNAFAAPPSRTGARAFFAMSFNFLGSGKDALNLPFAGANTGKPVVSDAAAPAESTKPPTPPTGQAGTTGLTVSDPSLIIDSGTTVTLTFSWKGAAPPEGSLIGLSADPSGVITVETQTKLIPTPQREGEWTAAVEVKALRTGKATITATLGSGAEKAEVTSVIEVK